MTTSRPISRVRSPWSLIAALFAVAAVMLAGLGSAAPAAAADPETGTISVTKVIDDPSQTVDPNFVFTGTWRYCSTGAPAGSGTWSTRANETWTSEPLLAGYDVCIEEDSSAYNAYPGGGLWEYRVETPTGISTVVAGQNLAFTVTNWYRPPLPEPTYGYLTLTKEVIDVDGLADPNAVYTGTYSFPDGFHLADGSPYSGQTVTWALAAGGSLFGEVPTGATVTFTEDAPAPITGATWTSEVPDPIEMGTNTVENVVVRNTLTKDPVEPETGSISVTKVVDDLSEIVDPDFVYTGTWRYCSTGAPTGGGTWSAAANETWTFSPVLAGYDVCVEEDASAGGAAPGGTLWEYTVTTPGDISTIVPGESTDFTVRNTYITIPEPQFSFFTVTKDLIDPDGLADPDAAYTGTYSFPDGIDLATSSPYSGQSGTWSVTAGSTSTLFLVPAGATVTLTEDSPAGIEDATWASAVPDPTEIPSGTVTDLVVTNTLTADDVPVEPRTGSFTIENRVIDLNGLTDPDTVYTGTYSYPAGDGYPAGSGTWSARANENWTSGPVPIGAVVTVTLDVLDPITGATWSTVIGDPVTITEDAVVELIVTSALTKPSTGGGSDGGGPTTGTNGTTTPSSTSRGPSSTHLAQTGADLPSAGLAFGVLLLLAGLVTFRRRGGSRSSS